MLRDFKKGPILSFLPLFPRLWWAGYILVDRAINGNASVKNIEDICLATLSGVRMPPLTYS